MALLIYLLCIGYHIALTKSDAECTDRKGGVPLILKGERLDVECHEIVDKYKGACNPNAPENVNAAEICCKSCQGVDYTTGDLPITFKFGGNKYTCQDIKGDMLYFCENSEDVKNGCKNACAKSITGSQCFDYPGFDCKTYIDKFTCTFCTQPKYSRLCCQSCKTFMDLGKCGCFDDLTWENTLRDGTQINCFDLKQDKFKCLCRNKLYRTNCCETCQDIDANVCSGDCVGWKRTVRGQTYTEDCDLLMSRFPFICKQRAYYYNDHETGGVFGQCCETCGRLHAAGLVGVSDNPFRTFNISGEMLMCEDFIGEYACLCDKRQISKACVGTCNQVDLQKCGCKDLINKENEYEYRGKKYNSCPKLLKSFPGFCNKIEFNQDAGGLCCKSCKKMDTTCVDDVDYYLEQKFRRRTKRYSCEEVAQRYPLLCTSDQQEGGVRDICCHSCTKQYGEDPGDICGLDQSWRQKVQVPGKLHKKITCRNIKSKGLAELLCCNEEYAAYNAKKACCSVCRDFCN